MPSLERKHALAFLNRGWEHSRALKDRYTARNIGKLGAAEALRYQDMLWDHVGHRSQTTREEDLQAHRALIEKLERYAEFQAGARGSGARTSRAFD